MPDFDDESHTGLDIDIAAHVLETDSSAVLGNDTARSQEASLDITSNFHVAVATEVESIGPSKQDSEPEYFHDEDESEPEHSYFHRMGLLNEYDSDSDEDDAHQDCDCDLICDCEEQMREAEKETKILKNKLKMYEEATKCKYCNFTVTGKMKISKYKQKLKAHVNKKHKIDIAVLPDFDDDSHTGLDIAIAAHVLETDSSAILDNDTARSKRGIY